MTLGVPSGQHLDNYGKSQLFKDNSCKLTPIWKLTIFHEQVTINGREQLLEVNGPFSMAVLITKEYLDPRFHG